MIKKRYSSKKNIDLPKPYNSNIDPNAIPQYGWGSAIGTGLGALAAGALAIPTGGMSLAAMPAIISAAGTGASLGSMLGGSADQIIGNNDTTQNKPNYQQGFTVDPLNTQGYYNPIKAYGGKMYPEGGTILTPAEEVKYQQWRKTIPSNLQYEGDYDLRGFYKENPNWTPSNPKVHMGDKYKLSNHPTFSNESKYYNYNNWNQGGTWNNNNMFVPNDPLQPKFLDSTNPEVSTRLYPEGTIKLAYGGNLYPQFPGGGQITPEMMQQMQQQQGGQPNAEVEGNEVIQHDPNAPPQAVGQGNMQQIASDMSVAQGPTHANGGVPVNAAPGSMVVSDRIPAPNTKEYKSIANKVEMLGRKKGQLEKKLKLQPNDTPIQNALELIQKQIDTLISQQEEMKQENAANIMQKAQIKAYGGHVNPYNIPLHKDNSSFDLNNLAGKGYANGGEIDPTFLKYWNWGGMYADGGMIPKYYMGDIIPPYSGVQPQDEFDMQQNNITQPIVNNYSNAPLRYTPQQGINKNKQQFGQPYNANPWYTPTTINKESQYIPQGATNPMYKDLHAKTPLADNLPNKNTLGNGLMYAAQFIPDIAQLFQKTDKPMNPNDYMTQQGVNPARYDTTAEEAATLDARNQAMRYAKESSGGDAGAYANMATAGINNSYKNLGQVYGRAQNINMQNNMQAQQANIGIDAQNKGMVFQVANANAADRQAVEANKMRALQGLGNKLSQNYSQNKQFQLLDSMFPDYSYVDGGIKLSTGAVLRGEHAQDYILQRSQASQKIMGQKQGGQQ